MYCNNCGNQLPDSAKFCHICGQKVNNNDKQGYYPSMKPKGQVETEINNFSYQGNGTTSEIKVLKCPCCGDSISAFALSCKSCGAELRRSDSLASVKEFAQRLREIEATRKGTISKVFDYFSQSANETDVRLANEIKNYSIPNTKEDIYEFLILASPNIDPTAFNRDQGRKSTSEYKSKLMISEAWISKYEQAYQKALLMFPNDPRLQSVQEVYDKKQKQIKKEKFKEYTPILVVIASFAALIILMIILSCFMK